MRHFNLIHDIDGSVDEYWRLFLDPEYERNLYREGFGFPSYELLESTEDEAGLRRKIGVQPKLDMPAVLADLFGPSFGYVEEATYDKAQRLYKSRMTPNGMGARLVSQTVVRAEPAADGCCKRICEVSVEARIFGLGSIVEMVVEKNVRSAWDTSAAYLNQQLQAARQARSHEQAFSQL